MKDKVKILLVEDNLLNQKLVSFMLSDWGYQYSICSNGKLAVEKLENESYDLILMDLQMPEMNGYEATNFIRQNLKLKIPIIAMSSFTVESEVDKCMDMGMSNYISKPIKESHLHRLILDNLSPKDLATA